MTPEESSQSERRRKRDELNEVKRQAEMEAGALAVKRYAMFEAVEKGTLTLRTSFPRLLIGTVINKPYTHVTVRAEAKVNLAPLGDMAVLKDELVKPNIIELEDPIETFPSDHLVAQLALIA